MRTIMIAIVVLISITTSGCLYQSVSKSDIDNAEIICKSHGGVVNIDASWTGHEDVTCVDLTIIGIWKNSIEEAKKENAELQPSKGE